MKAAFNAWRKEYRLGGYSVEEVRNGVDILPPDKVEPFVSAHRAAILTRLPFLTNGKKMGITLLGVEEGDIACLIYGTNVPFVLREVFQQEGREQKKLIGCKLVSEAYCHSLMDGDGMRGLNGDPLILQSCDEFLDHNVPLNPNPKGPIVKRIQNSTMVARCRCDGYSLLDLVLNIAGATGSVPTQWGENDDHPVYQRSYGAADHTRSWERRMDLDRSDLHRPAQWSRTGRPGQHQEGYLSEIGGDDYLARS